MTLRASKKIYLIVTIDTEEDNWGYDGRPIQLNNIYQIPRLQELFNSFGIRPIYLCTTPVIDNSSSCKIIKNIFNRGQCHIGVHLHPWNSPPILEDLSKKENTHLINLPWSIVKKKIILLTEKIERRFGRKPIIFRAGRWSFSAGLAHILSDLGFRIDTSLTPFSNWSNFNQGSDFRSCPPNIEFIANNICSSKPFQKDGLWEVPVSIGFNRCPFSYWNWVYQVIHGTFLRKIRLIGFMHVTGILKKIWLSPEFNNAKDMLTLSQLMVSQGANLLNFTFHSNSLLSGLNPFVRTHRELIAFEENIKVYFNKLSSIGNVVSIGPDELNQLLNAGLIRSTLHEKQNSTNANNP